MSHRCPHPAVGRIAWPIGFPRPEGPRAVVDVCYSEACRRAAYDKVQEITGHRGEYVPYPAKPRRATRAKPASPRRRISRAAEASVPWDVLGALIVAAPTEIEEWAEKRLGADVVTQAIKAAEPEEASA